MVRLDGKRLRREPSAGALLGALLGTPEQGHRLMHDVRIEVEEPVVLRADEKERTSRSTPQHPRALRQTEDANQRGDVARVHVALKPSTRGTRISVGAHSRFAGRDAALNGAPEGRARRDPARRGRPNPESFVDPSPPSPPSASPPPRRGLAPRHRG